MVWSTSHWLRLHSFVESGIGKFSLVGLNILSMFGSFVVYNLHHLILFGRVGGAEILDIGEKWCKTIFIKHVYGLITG